MRPASLARALLMILIPGTAALAFCSDMLWNLHNWGQYDWDLFFFHDLSNYRSVVEFGEPPLWNPWYRGGFPMIGNPQTASFDPWFMIDLIAGPIAAIKIKIVAHYILGLAGTYWCARQVRLSRLAATYVAGTFIFSTWLALRVHSGHQNFIPGVYMPWAIGMLYRACEHWTDATYAGLAVALIVLEGGGAHVGSLIVLSCSLISISWAIQKRSLAPLVGLILMVVIGAGVSAVKLLPTIKLLGQYPRYTPQGGVIWSKYAGIMFGPSRGGKEEERVSPDSNQVSTEDAADRREGATDVAPTTGVKVRPSKRDLPAFLTKAFLGREQRSDTFYFPIQSFPWQEYGVYIGPLAVMLLAISPLCIRTAWPWMVVIVFCFLTAMGNFAPFAPWTLMHRLPVLSNMRVPSRFLIPTVFAMCMLSGVVLDHNRRGLERWASGGSRRVEVVLRLIVAAALIDSFLVGRGSLKDAFPLPEPSLEPRLPAIVTIKRVEGFHTAEAMLANYCVIHADEAIPFPPQVSARERKDYRGELYFVSEAPREAVPSKIMSVELLDWSPNSVRVRVDTKVPGFVVLNRNWEGGWSASRPYKAASYNGLIAARVEPGIHTIRFLYRPLIVAIGLGMSLLSLVAVFSWCLLSRRRRPG